MKSVKILPENYSEIYSVDLKKNKKLYLFLNVLSILIGIVLFIPMNFYKPLTTLFEGAAGTSDLLFRIIVMYALMILYIVLHELVHGIAMKICGTKKVKYGFKGVFAYAGSDDYYDKKSYIFIALAPVVLWGIILAAVNCIVPEKWFWIVYAIQLINLSGAAGDFFVTVKFSKLPKNVLIRDSGVGMTVFSLKD